MEGGRRQSVLERSWRSVCFQNLFIATWEIMMELDNLLREHLLVNPGHLNFPAIARPVAVLFAVIGRFLKQVEKASSFLNRICDWLSKQKISQENNATSA